MSVRQKFVYSWPEGVQPIQFHEWIGTLPESEQLEFNQAKEQQIAYREKAVSEGRMYIDENHNYIWRDEETKTQGKGYDDTWLHYWNRYLSETQTIFKIEEEEC